MSLITIPSLRPKCSIYFLYKYVIFVSSFCSTQAWSSSHTYWLSIPTTPFQFRTYLYSKTGFKTGTSKIETRLKPVLFPVHPEARARSPRSWPFWPSVSELTSTARPSSTPQSPFQVSRSLTGPSGPTIRWKMPYYPSSSLMMTFHWLVMNDATL